MKMLSTVDRRKFEIFTVQTLNDNVITSIRFRIHSIIYILIDKVP